MTTSCPYFTPRLPDGLEGLVDLALDLRWSWSHAADELWRRIDPALWETTHNAWLVLQTATEARLTALAADPEFREMLAIQLQARGEAFAASTWFQKTYTDPPFARVAYFSMEFGLSEALPIYSGGLGILAGDLLKTASDLGVPVLGVGLLYQQGYFHQALDARGEQIEFYPYNEPSQLPVMPVRNGEGDWLHVTLEFPGRTLRLRAWQVQVGRVRLYLLDSNSPLNSPADRGITAELYGGGQELRLQQEIVLGIGGWRLLQTLGLEPEVCHLNEGHAALAVLERARSFMAKTGQRFQIALRCTRAGNLFTTHTPVAAGFDRFRPQLLMNYARYYAELLGIGVSELLALGRADPNNDDEPFNMAYLALRGSGAVNGVSRLHGAVSQRIFQPLFPRFPQVEVPIGHITNGVHTPSWDSAEADSLWTDVCGKGRWLGAPETFQEHFAEVPDEVLWNFRVHQRQALIHYARERIALKLAAIGASKDYVEQARQYLDPNALTLGFARRFATYKRPALLLHDPERLARLLTDPQRPVQLIIAGKSHPQDAEGKSLVRTWSAFVRRPDVRARVFFLADYDMRLAEQLVQGVDVWINTPRRPWEACGTSGMKVLVNGGLNLSELDGWWAEAYNAEVGWALGDGREHDDDPGWDGAEAEQLYALLEQEIVPRFYERDEHGIPRRWVARMRPSMAELTPCFSANRMLREYTERHYLPLAEAYRRRAADNGAPGIRLEDWCRSLGQHWPQLHLGDVQAKRASDSYEFRVQAYLNELAPEAVRVELYADPLGDSEPVRIPMVRKHALVGAVNSYLYVAKVPAERPATDYTPRLLPAANQAAFVPLEANWILWPR